MALHPAPNRVVLALNEKKQESSQGIVLAGGVSGEPPQGRVIDIGYAAKSHLEGLSQGDIAFFVPGRERIVAVAGTRRIVVHFDDVLAWTDETPVRHD